MKGNARLRLAEMGVDSKENLETAVSLYEDAQEIFSKTSADYARALMNEGTCKTKTCRIWVLIARITLKNQRNCT